ncbi:PEPxxWA-CTERM sorting domain-containing protein [Sphingomonas sp. ID1715]|uniref:esterase-like activity of phytase family protein n=1 Tax=Sphingomonas sp. ID1715 TaxID=1656898 RepID=UPI0014890FAC|nr:PEPxxWA-CTERM sorting domain-containing protein [Sphingomonas sp. ID1715]
MRLGRLLLASACALAPAAANAAITFVNKFEIAGGATDLSALGNAFASNRLSIGSDLYYDRGTNTFYGITDRGPGGGVIDFTPRVHSFKLDISLSTGAVNGFNLQSTTLFRDTDGMALTGLNPLLAGGSVSNLGRSFDSEGFVKLPNGNFLVSDEYGPAVYEFAPNGTKLRAFTTPDNLIPKQSNGTVNYVDGRPTITKGRQDNRGFEGLTVSRDGTKAYAILQDPLVNEGTDNGAIDGRRSRNLRIVEFDIATGQSIKQYIYQLESRSDINDRIPGTNDDFNSSSQGRNIGVSSITPLEDGSFVVIERDNRGLGVDPASSLPIGSKRVYRIRLEGATDVSNVDLTNTNTLPNGVKPVQKSLYLDIQAALKQAGFDAVEKLEGLSFGPVLSDGSLGLYIVSDNDFSVTQDAGNVQFDVCVGAGGRITVPLGSGCPDVGGQPTSLLPTVVYAFRVSGADAVGVVPEPASWAMMIAGFGLAGASMRRRKVAFA